MQDERFGAPRRPRANGSNGFRPEALHTRPVRFDEISDDPVDLVAVQADDELINALASGMSVSSPGYGGYDADDHVVAMLAAWKSEVDAEPLPELVDLEVAAERVRAAARPAGRSVRYLVPVAAAAAVAVFTIGGLTIGAGNAGPEDGVLWEIARVVDSDRTESVLAAERVEERIAEAKEALERGEPAVAAQLLAAAEDELVVVRVEEGAAGLAEVQSFLEAKAAETPPGIRTEPGAPLASDPTRPVPPGAGTDEPVSTSSEAVDTSSSEPEVTSPEVATAPDPSLTDESSTTSPESSVGPTSEGDPESPSATPETEGGPDGGAPADDTTFGSFGSTDDPPADPVADEPVAAPSN